MFKKKYDLAIVNRSFWPQSEILGEAKLRLAEKVAENGAACVITQANIDIQNEAIKQKRGGNVKLCVARSRSNSSSGIVRRLFDAALFGPFVFFSLCRLRPKHVYVSTNPPVVIPFLVFLYCKLFRAKYTYHLQDIHPEITNIVYPMNRIVFRVLRGLDNITLRNASSLLTLSTEMAEYLRKCSGTKAPIHLIDNPAFEVSENIRTKHKIKDFVFCGNAGRVQQIPVLIAAIRKYLSEGGSLSFSFAGAGVYSSDIATLAKDFKDVTYHGYVSADMANQLVATHRWALLPILDEVTRYAFPSKSSSYLAAHCHILAVCGSETSVAKWVADRKVGVTCAADEGELVDTFRKLERENNPPKGGDFSVQTIDDFVDELSCKIMSELE